MITTYVRQNLPRNFSFDSAFAAIGVYKNEILRNWKGLRGELICGVNFFMWKIYGCLKIFFKLKNVNAP